MFYLNFLSMGALVTTCFLATVGFFVLTIRKKSRATMHWGIFFLYEVVHNSAFLAAFGYYDPIVAYHRWFSICGALLGLTHVTQFFFHFPDDKPHAMAPLIMKIQYVITGIITSAFVIKSLLVGKIFLLDGEFWNVDESIFSIIVAIVILAFTFLFICVGIWRYLNVDQSKRWQVAALLSSTFFAAIIPAIFNVLAKSGIISHIIFYTIWFSITIAGWFMITILYLNLSKDRTSIMHKISGVSLASAVLFILSVSYIASYNNENSYRKIHREISLRALAGKKYNLKEIAYIKIYPFLGDPLYLHRSHDGIDVSDLPSEGWALKEDKIGKAHYKTLTRFHKESMAYIETGFNYLQYRQFRHTPQVHILVIFCIIYILVLVGYRFLFAGALVEPLNALIKGLKQAESGDLLVYVPPKIEDEVGYLTHSFNAMMGEIRDHTQNLELMVNSRTQRLSETIRELHTAQLIADRDMEMAVAVQRSYLPQEAPVSDEWDIAYHFQPMSGVSGDFYDFYIMNNKLRGLGLFDVSGHGIASGLVGMLARSIIFRNFLMGTRTDAKLHRAMENANTELIREIGTMDNYLTGIMLRLKGDRIEYVNAGHPDIIYRGSKTGKSFEILNKNKESISGHFLGIEIMERPYSQLTLKLSQGDSLLLFTDCLIEARNKEEGQFGVETLLKTLSSAPQGNAREMLDSILTAFYDYTKTQKLDDDLSIIVLQKK